VLVCVIMSNNNPTSTALSDVSKLLELVAEDRAESAATATFFKDSMGGRMHILLDILLTNSWQLAVVNVTMATAAKYPDLRIESDIPRQLHDQRWKKARIRARWFARKTAGDADGLDLAWMMIAADPKSTPWSYAFVHKMAATVFALTGSAGFEETIYNDALRKLERWENIRDGYPALGEDPFYAVTDELWHKADLLRAKQEEHRRDELAKKQLKERESAPPVVVLEDDIQDDAGEDIAGVVVISGSPKLSEPYKSLIGSRTPLHLADGVVGVRNALRAEFPHCLDAIDLMMLDLRDGEPLRFRPFMLVGEPGCGKSRLIRRMAQLLGGPLASAPMRRFDGAGSGDNTFSGTSKQWSTARPCFPLTCIAETSFANPILMVDEIDKAPPGFWHGSLHTALMPFLERETAAAYPDPGFEIQVDVSHVNYCATANDDSKLPKPLKDRLRVIRVPAPGKAQLEMLCASILKDLAVELAIPPAFLMPLAPDELDVVRKAWGDNGSVRKLQKIVRGTVTARDQHAVRH
jgi:ATP-dependent Lon protease